MTLSWKKALTIARREFVTTVRRRGFLFTALGTPAYFALVMSISIGSSAHEARDVLKAFRSLGVVDSTGLFERAERSIDTSLKMDENPFAQNVEVRSFRTDVHFFEDMASADSALRTDAVSQVLVIPADYLETGRLRRYARKSSIFSSADRRPIASWLVGGLVAGRLDSLQSARAMRPTEQIQLYTLDKDGRFQYSDDRRDLLDFLLPFGFAMLLGLCITVGGQYLLYGVATEKESRVLESILCNVSAEELLAGKLLGLGSSGLLLVAFWIALGIPFVGAAAIAAPVSLSPVVLVAAVCYFAFGYLFYASLMTGIGSITSNMREAQQFAVWFTFSNFAPFIVITMILSNPSGPLATGLSMFPPTAATTMLMRLTAPSSVVPGWQVLLSLVLLAGSSLLALMVSARVFRIGLLMYGKTPNLPEIIRWARRG
jgi:ABC-2 type transport system permease protein